MTKKERRQFVTDLVKVVNDKLMSKVDNTPDDWDGFELRQWIADTFSHEVGVLRLQAGRRRAYRNAVAVNNL